MKYFFTKKTLFLIITFLGVFLFALFNVYADEGVEFSIEQTIAGEDFPEILFVNKDGTEVLTPNVDFSENLEYSFDPQVSTGVLGKQDSIVRINNATVYDSFDLHIAPDVENSESDAYWKDGENEYSISSEDSHLSLDLHNNGGLNIEETGACSNINVGSNASFRNYDQIEILNAQNSASCRLDIENILFEQLIPAEQAVGSYALDMVLTVSSAAFDTGSGTKEDPYRISNCEELRDVGKTEDWTLDKHYKLVNDIDCDPNEPFEPIVDLEGEEPFSGTLDGKNEETGENYEIRNLTANPMMFDEETEAGFLIAFGSIPGESEAKLSNIDFVDITIEAGEQAMPILPFGYGGEIDNVNVNDGSTISSGGFTSGLFVGWGDNIFGEYIVKNSRVDAELTNGWIVGGITAFVDTELITFENCEFGGTIEIEDVGFEEDFMGIGGFAGFMQAGNIKSSKVSGDLAITGEIQTRDSVLSGFIANANPASHPDAVQLIIENSYFEGEIEIKAVIPEGEDMLFSGFAGAVSDDVIIENSYSSGKLIGSEEGLYSVGFINILFGENHTLTSSYFDKEKAGTDTGVGNQEGYEEYIKPKTTSEMQQLSTFENWDIGDLGDMEDIWTKIWAIDDGNDYPRLYWELNGELNGEEDVPIPIASKEDYHALGEGVMHTFAEGEDEEITTAGNLDDDYYLVDDIDMEGDSSIKAADFQPALSSDKAFSGTIDGNGFTISNIDNSEGVWVDPDSYKLNSLFLATEGAEFTDLYLENINVDVSHDFGNDGGEVHGSILSGWVLEGIDITGGGIMNSNVSASVTGGDSSSDASAGGVVNVVFTGHLSIMDFDIDETHVSSDAYVSGDYFARAVSGGVVGGLVEEGGPISNSFYIDRDISNPNVTTHAESEIADRGFYWEGNVLGRGHEADLENLKDRFTGEDSFYLTRITSAPPVEEGDEMNINADIYNIGGDEGSVTQDVVLYIDGEEKDRINDVYVESGEIENVTLYWNTEVGDGVAYTNEGEAGYHYDVKVAVETDYRLRKDFAGVVENADSCYAEQANYTDSIHDQNRRRFSYWPDDKKGSHIGCPVDQDWSIISSDGEGNILEAKDETSGLHWSEPLGCGLNWYEAAGIMDPDLNPDNRDPCGSLGGDWRLPTYNELLQVLPHKPDELNLRFSGTLQQFNNHSGNDMYGFDEDFAMRGTLDIDGRTLFWAKNEWSGIADFYTLVVLEGGTGNTIRVNAGEIGRDADCVRCVK